MSDDVLHSLVITTTGNYGSTIEEMLPILDFYPTSYFDIKDDFATLSLYFDSEKEAKSASEIIYSHLPEWSSLCGEDLTGTEIIYREIHKEDWSESWKAFFKTDKISERLVIKPSWLEYEAQDGEVILEIDPGMSFGTGSHGTTKACLQFIDEISQPGMNFIDMGCGSGILSLAAAKLGLDPVHAFDYDEEAVRIAAENLEHSNISIDRLFQQDLTDFKSDMQYDIVIANILAPVLIMNADTIRESMKKDGRLILAGILHEQFEEIEECFVELGLKLVERRRIDEWSSGLFEVENRS